MKFYFKVYGGVRHARKVGVAVGENCRIYISDFGSEPWLISIGNKVTVTSGVKFITHDGSTWLFSDEKGRRFLYRQIIVKNNVFIGIDAILLPGVIVEDNVIIAAGSVVTKSIPEGVIVGGNPAKIIGKFSDYKSNVLSNYITQDDLDMKVDYKSRIEKIINADSKTFLKS